MAIPLSPKDLQDQFIGPVKPNEAPPSFGEIDFLKESQFVGPRRPKALKASDIPFGSIPPVFSGAGSTLPFPQVAKGSLTAADIPNPNVFSQKKILPSKPSPFLQEVKKVSEESIAFLFKNTGETFGAIDRTIVDLQNPSFLLRQRIMDSAVKNNPSLANNPVFLEELKKMAEPRKGPIAKSATFLKEALLTPVGTAKRSGLKLGDPKLDPILAREVVGFHARNVINSFFSAPSNIFILAGLIKGPRMKTGEKEFVWVPSKKSLFGLGTDIIRTGHLKEVEVISLIDPSQDRFKQTALNMDARLKDLLTTLGDLAPKDGKNPLTGEKVGTKSTEVFATKGGGFFGEFSIDILGDPFFLADFGPRIAARTGKTVAARAGTETLFTVLKGFTDSFKKSGIRDIKTPAGNLKFSRLKEIFIKSFKGIKLTDKEAAVKKFAEKVAEIEKRGTKVTKNLFDNPESLKAKTEFVEFAKDKIRFIPDEDLGKGVKKFLKTPISKKNIDQLISDGQFILRPVLKKGTKKLIPLAKTQTISDFVRGTVAPRLKELAPKLQKQILANERKLGRIPATSLEDLASFVEIAGGQTVDLAKNLIDSEAGARAAFDTVDEASTFFRQVNDLLPKNIAAIIKEQTAPLSTRGVEVKTAGVVSKEGTKINKELSSALVPDIQEEVKRIQKDIRSSVKAGEFIQIQPISRVQKGLPDLIKIAKKEKINLERFRPLGRRSPQKSGVEQIKERIALQNRLAKVSKRRDEFLSADFGVQLSAREVEHLGKFMDKIGTKMFEDVRLSMRNVGIDSAGLFDFENAIITLSKQAIGRGQLGVKTMVHELWHSLSRSLPVGRIKLFQTEFLRNKKIFAADNPWFDFIIKKGRQNFEGDYILTKKLVDEFSKKFKDAGSFLRVRPRLGPTPPLTSESKFIYKFDEETYRFKNIDEYFAEVLSERSFIHDFSPRAKTFIGKIKDIFFRVIDSIRGFFGKPVSTGIEDKTYDDFLARRFPIQIRRGPLQQGIDKTSLAEFFDKAKGATPQPRSGLKFTPKKGAKILKGGEAIPAGKDLGPEAVQGRIHPITASLKKIVKEAFGAPASRFQVVDIPRTPLTQKFIRKISNHPFALGFQELFHDRFVRIVRALESTGIKFEDKNNIITRIRLDPARLRSILEDVQKETTKKVVKEIFDVSKIEGVGKAPKEIQKLIGDFMRARHVPRLNKAIAKDTGGAKLAGAGITNKEAAKIKKEIENLPYFSKLKPIIDRLQEINNDTLFIAQESGLISKKQSENLLKTFKGEHVPSQRIIEGKEDQEVLGVFFKAKGSEREVQDVVESILLNHQQTIKRAFTNKTRKIAALNFTEAKKLGHPGARVIKGEKALQKEGLTIKDDMAVPFFEKGKKRVLVFDDALVAKALTGNNIQSWGSLDRAIEILGKITRLRANTFTTLNPEFPLINTVRDIQELFLTVDSTEGIVEASKATLQAASLKGQKSVFDYLRGAKSEGATLYKKLIDAGGAGSGLTAQNRKQFKVSVEKEFKALQRGKLNPIKAGQEIFKVLENVSTIFEDGTRLVAFDRALKRGATVDQAALIAKESTVNFDKRGTVGHILNSIWMFSNASIQGTARTIKSLSNPKTFIKASSLQLSGAIAQQRWNDSIDPEWRDKISDYERDNNYTILLPPDGIVDDFPRMSIPVAWGLKPIKVMSDVFADIISGNLQPGDRSYDRLVSSLVTSYAPIQGSTIFQTAAPSVIVPFVQIVENEKWNNAQIFPENRAGQVNNSEKEWNPDSDSILDRGARTVARRMKETIGVDKSPEVLKFILSEVGGGTERFLEKAFITSESIIKGKKNENTSDIPIIGRIFKTTPSPQAKKRIIKKDRERVTNLIKDTFDEEKRKEILRDFAIDRDREEVIKDFNILRLKEDISAEGVKLTEKPRFPESKFNKETGAWDRPAWSEYYDYYRAPFNVYGGMTREEASVRADIQFFGGSVKDIPKKIKTRAVLLELEFRGELPPKKQEAIDELRRRGEFPPPL